MPKKKCNKHGLKIRFEPSLLTNNLARNIAGIIRRINMDYHPLGFGGNAGWTDSHLTNRFGFSWYFDSNESCEKAHQDLFALLNPKVLTKMNVEKLGLVSNRKKTFYKRVERN